MRMPVDIRVQLAYFYLAAAYYASFCRLYGLSNVWAMELAALAVAQERWDVGVNFVTFAVGYWYMLRATHWAYRVSWCACQGAAMGIWVHETLIRGGDRELFSYIVRCMLTVLSHVAIMRGCCGPSIWPPDNAIFVR